MSRTAWIVSIALLILLAGSTYLRNFLGVEWSPESVRATVRDAGIWAPLLFIALVTFRLVILVPSQILLAAAGLLFGAALGALYGAIGMTLSAILNFAAVRVAGIDRIREQLPRRFSGALDVAQSKLGAGALVLASGYPVGPISAFQIGAALTGMSFLSFVVAVSIGSAVRAATYSYLGSTLFDGYRLIYGAAAVFAAAAIPLLFPGPRARILAIFATAMGNREPNGQEEQ
ncbi:MAG: TVP38/TMEM64 family protein [Deltaproteobacteria bacterium]|nr:TVP38/TMEM64 family protein [Deltaproteobacteria bacterium]MBW2400635.1 TVP38/TMEM64 family protein [Deltaproteobacteria bacterium]MBW2666676.1 TVP38/TMEM64 family protein [Deltaproteobacteria bacterium]